jgi:signal transduction histidine kinase
MTHRVRVLYAEDDPMDADRVRFGLSDSHPELDLTVVGTGGEFLSAVSGADPAFDVLLLDHRLPDMESTELLAELARQDVATPRVLVTGVGDESLVVRALRLGAADYLPKQPGWIDDLGATLLAVLERNEAARRAGKLARSVRRVLYVEHNSMDVDLTVRALAEVAPHLTVDTLARGEEAVRVLTGPHEYDLVLLDLRLPDLGALEVIRQVQARVELPPFLLVTGKGDDETAIAALKLGAFDYLSKRDGYLEQLPHSIEHAIDRRRLGQANVALRAELEARVEAERAVVEAGKAEAVGRLAAGVAHDLNNLLSVVSLGLSAVRDEPLTLSQMEAMADVQAAVRSAANVVRDLVAFARNEALTRAPVDLGAMVSGLSSALTRLLGSHIALRVSLPPGPVVVEADRTALERVVLNLATNARDALPSGGTLRLSVGEVQLEQGAGPPPGRYGTLTVTDSGDGIPAEVLPRLFEPFFTTKSAGRGAGLGLASVRGLVEQQGGVVRASNDASTGGARFEVLLPASEGPVAPEAETPPMIAPAAATVLVVEDWPAVRRMMVRALKGAGYQVMEAEDGPSALRLCQGHDGPIDIVVTDQQMPGGLLGSELVVKLKQLRPTIRSLLVSGTLVTQADVDAQLAKPVSVSLLTATLARLLAERE